MRTYHPTRHHHLLGILCCVVLCIGCDGRPDRHELSVLSFEGTLGDLSRIPDANVRAYLRPRMQNAISLLENDPSEISPDPFIVIALIQRGLMNEGSGNGVCVWLTWLEINNRTGGVYIKESDGSRRTEVRWDPHSNRQITKMSSFTRFVPVVMDEKSYEAALAHGCTEGEYLDIRSFKRGAPLVAGMLNEEGHALKPIAVFVTDLLAERWEHGGATNSDE